MGTQFSTRVLSLLTALFVATALAACGDSTGSVDQGISPNNNQAAGGAATGASGASSASGASASIVSNAMTMADKAYSPNPIKIQPGTTVTWTNNDSIAHTVTSDTGVFDSGNLAPGQTFKHTFSDAGTFPYHCTIHPSMVGTVQVSAP